MLSGDYLISVIKQFEYYKGLADKTFENLSDEQLFWKYNDESNSIATIVKHIHGNMISRWTDFLYTDGEKEWRERDAEFYNDMITREEMLSKWNEGWSCLFGALDSLKDEDFSKTVFIRNQPHTVISAINRQLAHYPYHIGQIVYIGKMLLNGNWVTLSIPKGNSRAFNTKMMIEKKMTEF